jgi:hypothetical protein
MGVGPNNMLLLSLLLLSVAVADNNDMFFARCEACKMAIEDVSSSWDTSIEGSSLPPIGLALRKFYLSKEGNDDAISTALKDNLCTSGAFKSNNLAPDIYDECKQLKVNVKTVSAIAEAAMKVIREETQPRAFISTATGAVCFSKNSTICPQMSFYAKVH